MWILGFVAFVRNYHINSVVDVVVPNWSGFCQAYFMTHHKFETSGSSGKAKCMAGFLRSPGQSENGILPSGGEQNAC